MSRLAVSAALAAALAIGGGSIASSQSVFWTGHVYHVQACGAAAPGTARCHAHVVTDNVGHPFRLMVGGGRVIPARGRQPAPTVTGGPYGAGQLEQAYRVSGGGVSGTIVAIVDAYGYPNAASDLAAYRSQYGLGVCGTSNGCLSIVNESGGSRLPRANAGWDEEQALDLDMVSAMCPNCRIVLVQANSASYTDLGNAENEAAILGAHAIGNSYGGSESGTTSYASRYYNHPGIAITASAGDSGYGVSFPASSNTVIAVGGTSLVWNGSSRTETVWSGTGSGCSKVYGEPSWQQPTNSNMAKNTLCTMRMMNDVSAVADPNTGVIVYMNIPPYSPGFYIFGGTSASAQIISGIYAAANGPVTNGGVPTPYAPSAQLNDVTSGSDGSCGGTYFCTAGKGYDGPTGLGTPSGTSAF